MIQLHYLLPELLFWVPHVLPWFPKLILFDHYWKTSPNYSANYDCTAYYIVLGVIFYAANLCI